MKDKEVRISMSATVWAEIQHYAELAGVTVIDYMIQASLHYPALLMERAKNKLMNETIEDKSNEEEKEHELQSEKPVS